MKRYKENFLPKMQQAECWVKPPFTFTSLSTVHGEVSGLVCLQATSLHSWPKHFDLLGMATLSDADLERTGRRAAIKFFCMWTQQRHGQLLECHSGGNLQHPALLATPSSKVHQAWCFHVPALTIKHGAQTCPRTGLFHTTTRILPHDLPCKGCAGC